MYRLFVFVVSISISISVAFADNVVLQGDQMRVTEQDIENYIAENMPPEEANKTALLGRPGVFSEMAESLYVIRVLAAEAERELEVDEELARWSAEIAYKRKLTNAYRVHYISEALKDVNWDKTALEAYNAQSQLYVSKDAVKASHLLIRTDEHSEKEALELINSLRKRAVAGEDFADLASEYSEDSSVKTNAGNLGFFQRGSMTPPFEKAAFELKNVGDVSVPVKTKFGYHIIKLSGRKAAGLIPFESVKGKIVDQLQVQLGDQIWQDKIIALRSSPDLKLNLDLVKEIRERHISSAVIGKEK